jgi:hypothetical protein
VTLKWLPRKLEDASSGEVARKETGYVGDDEVARKETG